MKLIVSELVLLAPVLLAPVPVVLVPVPVVVPVVVELDTPLMVIVPVQSEFTVYVPVYCSELKEVGLVVVEELVVVVPEVEELDELSNVESELIPPAPLKST